MDLIVVRLGANLHSQLKHLLVIPVFAKDNEQTISHQEFVDTALSCAGTLLSNENIGIPEIRVSHQVKGRTPDAIYIPPKELFVLVYR